MSRLKTAFMTVHGWLEKLAVSNKPRVERVLGRLPNREDVEVVDFATDADLAMLRQEPLRARFLLRSIGLVFVLFVIWAAIAQLDEVTRGEGRVIPSKQLQVLQSIDGGLVSEILVREGDIVEIDQLLIKIDETRFVSSVKENRAQYLGLLARTARLRAIAEGSEFIRRQRSSPKRPKSPSRKASFLLPDAANSRLPCRSPGSNSPSVSRS